jgi:preprotein translocase subunit SecA
MMLGHRRRCVIGAGPLPAGTPYVEQPDRKDSRLDNALQHAWGRVSPYLWSGHERRKLERFVQLVENQEKHVSDLPDGRLRETADGLRGRLLSAGFISHDVALAFALVREATHRHAGLSHYHVQLLGGAAMLRGALSEMETGEGKTITAALPATAAALMGRPVHVITVNDYLARRDAEQLRPVYAALGLTTGLIEQGQDSGGRREAYAHDVTYCTNKEIVFDYLRDRLALGWRRSRARLLADDLLGSAQERGQGRLLQRGLHMAIVDEADSVLIDEARVPLILSGIQEGIGNDRRIYEVALDLARRLVSGEDFYVLANEKAIRLTDQGERRAMEFTSGLPGLWAVRRAREELIQQALSALHLFRRDVQYIVADGKVQIVDEFTGRVMPDRSWERGIHQLIEVKENCVLSERRQTLARITYQRFFRRYVHLCGMTGTAIEAAGELRAVYGLRVVRIPTNRPLRRTRAGTRMFSSAEQKWNAVVESVKAVLRQNRAVLIGTRSVEASERVGELLLAAGLTPVILNARQDQQEAHIVAGAGQPGCVLVATNMAGRGTDIQLHPAVQAVGGLHVVLTEYHEAARVDRQLFGRAGRQGDPGSYESIVALDDELIQRFAGEPLVSIAARVLPQSGIIPAVVACILRRHSQSTAERLNARNRRRALDDDQRVNRILSFAGVE